MAQTARRFLPMKGGANATDCPLTKPSLVVCSWNILADKYSTWLEYCTRECLDWTSRCPRILQELLSIGADIICLQEVERPFLDGELGAFMLKHGFEALFQPRPLRPPTKGEASPGQGGHEEGVALLYRSARLQLVASKAVRLGELVGLELQGALWERVRGLREGAVWALLHDRQAGRTLLAGCTHLYWQWPDAQIAQAHLLCQAGAELLQQAGLKIADTPVLLGGDFNSLPPLEVCCAATPARPARLHKSTGGVYQLLAHRRLPIGHPEHPAQGDPGLAQADFTTCGLQLRSVMAAAWGWEPPITSRAPNLTGCLDYLWASPHWEPAAALELPYLHSDIGGQSGGDAGGVEAGGSGGRAGGRGGVPEARVLEGQPFMPNEVCPSDHLALAALLVLTQ